MTKPYKAGEWTIYPQEQAEKPVRNAMDQFLDDLVWWAFNFLAALGAISLAAIVALYYAGFFTWALERVK